MKSKKDLKAEYKLRTFRMGIFQIRNTVNGKLYVESSVNLDAIWNRHKMQLKFGVHPNALLQSEWITFGEEQFRYEVLAELEQKEGVPIDYKKELKELEALYVKELQPFEPAGYHTRPIPTRNILH